MWVLIFLNIFLSLLFFCGIVIFDEERIIFCINGDIIVDWNVFWVLVLLFIVV